MNLVFYVVLHHPQQGRKPCPLAQCGLAVSLTTPPVEYSASLLQINAFQHDALCALPYLCFGSQRPLCLLTRLSQLREPSADQNFLCRV